MSTPTLLTDALIARRLEERTTIVDPGLVAEILRATEVRPQRRFPLSRAFSTPLVLLALALLLAALAAIGIATAPPRLPPGLQVRVGTPMGGLQLSPDGNWGLPMGPRGHVVASTDGNAPRNADGSYRGLFELKGAGGAAAWSPDSRYLAWYGTSDPGVVTIYDLERPGAAPDTIDVLPEVVGSAGVIGMRWSPDGSRILFETTNCEYPCSFSTSATQLYLLDVRTGSVQVVSLSLPPGFASAFAPDGQSIGFVGGLIVDLQGVVVRDLLPDLSNGPSSMQGPCGSGPVWSPDGRRIAIVDSASSDAARLLIFDPGASEPRVLTAHACRITGWAPDGGRLVFVTGDPFATKWVPEGNGGGLRPTGPGSDAWIIPVDDGKPELIKHLGWGEVPILTWAEPAG